MSIPTEAYEAAMKAADGLLRDTTTYWSGASIMHAALTAAAPAIQAAERARVIQAVHDAAEEFEPEEREGPYVVREAAIWITVPALNKIEGETE